MCLWLVNTQALHEPAVLLGSQRFGVTFFPRLLEAAGFQPFINKEMKKSRYDAQTNVLTFKTDRFSDYAIVYRDAKKGADVVKVDLGVADGSMDYEALLAWVKEHRV